eukprot:4297941-Prymnesium_polylepis.1
MARSALLLAVLYSGGADATVALGAYGESCDQVCATSNMVCSTHAMAAENAASFSPETMGATMTGLGATCTKG